MGTSQPCWAVRYKNRFLLAVMKELAGNAHISFEGNLGSSKLTSISGASEKETSVLKRNTIWPKQDFVVLPLERAMSRPILSALGGSIPKSVLHIQIEKAGVFEFGAFDNFHPECLFFGEGLSKDFLDSLVSQGLLKPQAKSRS
jgi:hypothetical protein